MTDRAYAILGVRSTASDEEIRAAYRRLAQIFHPDRFVSARADIREEAERRMMELNAAFSEIFRSREPRNSRPVEIPTWWLPSWDRGLQQESQWQEELKRRQEEAEEREVVHRRWEEIERIARKREMSWDTNDDRDGHPESRRSAQPTELPAKNAPTSDRIEQLRRTVDRERARQTRAATQRLRRTIDLDAREEREDEADRRSRR